MNIRISYCVCPDCKGKFPIPRSDGRMRPRDHLKRIFCPYCMKVTNMKEIREGDYYEDRRKYCL